jgi:hypothetical protein
MILLQMLRFSFSRFFPEFGAPQISSSLTASNSRAARHASMNVAENVHDHRVIVAELDLGKRHKGRSLGNKPDRQGSLILARDLTAW